MGYGYSKIGSIIASKTTTKLLYLLFYKLKCTWLSSSDRISSSNTTKINFAIGAAS